MNEIKRVSREATVELICGYTDQLSSVEDLKTIVHNALSERCTILDECWHRFEASDKGHVAGVTGVLILAESHFHISTWPEYKYAQITINSCVEDKTINLDAIESICMGLSATIKTLSERDYSVETPVSISE